VPLPSNSSRFSLSKLPPMIRCTRALESEPPLGGEGTTSTTIVELVLGARASLGAAAAVVAARLNGATTGDLSWIVVVAEGEQNGFTSMPS
jgi:hypothetical protein